MAETPPITNGGFRRAHPEIDNTDARHRIVHADGREEYITALQLLYTVSTVVDGIGHYLYVPTIKQAEGHDMSEPNRLIEGARGTGKSHMVRWHFHQMALKHPGFRYVIVRRTFQELNKTHLLVVSAEMKALGGTYKASTRFCHYSNGSVGIFSHCETEQDVHNLLGGEFHAIFFDEGTTFPWEWITKLATSVRVLVDSGLQPLVIIGTNPLGQSVDDIWKYYVEKDITAEEDSEYLPEDYGHLHMRMEDNAQHLDIQQYKKRFAGLPEHVRRAWLEGERMVSDALFDFRRTKDGQPWHEIHELPRAGRGGGHLLEQKWVRFYRVYDHGFYPDPAYCAWIAVVGRQVIPFKEKVWLRVHAEDIARDIVSETDRLGITVTATYCDPSIDLQTGADLYTVRDKMERCGLPLEPAVNNRELFAAAIHSLLNEQIEVADGVFIPRTRILQAGAGAGAGLGCPYLLKSLPAMRFDPKKPMAMAPHKHDHPSVAFAYFAMSSSAEAKTAEAIASPPRPWMRPVQAVREVLGKKQVRRSL